MSDFKSPVVAIFGSARVLEDTNDYQTAYQVGAGLAQAGYLVMSGGYAGVMAAVSEGAASVARAEVIGVTVTDLEAVGESIPNQWLTQEIRYQTLRERLHHLVDKADAYIVMPGGIGTLQELIEVWQAMRLGDIPRRPLIVYGDFWHAIIDHLEDSPYIGSSNRALIDSASTPDDLVSQLQTWFNEATINKDNQ